MPRYKDNANTQRNGVPFKEASQDWEKIRLLRKTSCQKCKYCDRFEARCGRGLLPTVCGEVKDAEKDAL